MSKKEGSSPRPKKSSEKIKSIWVTTTIAAVAAVALLVVQYRLSTGEPKIIPGIDSGESFSKPRIYKIYNRQSELSFRVSSGFNDYESSIFAYHKEPSKKNHAKMIKASNNLLNLLSKAEKEFGLNVTRWVNLFKIWQVQNNKRIESTSKNQKDYWDISFLSLQIRINKAIDQSKQDFNNEAFSSLIYNNRWLNSPSKSVESKINKIYESKAKALIPEQRKLWRQQTQGGRVTACMQDSFKITPTGLAKRVVFHQYYSRYCPFLVQSNTKELCNALMFIPVSKTDKERRIRLEQSLAICDIAKNRLLKESDQSSKRYGHLSYTDYYKQYVKPLVSKYVDRFKQSRRTLNLCNPNTLPVVGFRNPDIDAQSAAFLLEGPKLCDNFLES